MIKKIKNIMTVSKDFKHETMIKDRSIIIECDVNPFYNHVRYTWFDELNKNVHLKTIYESIKKNKVNIPQVGYINFIKNK